MERVSVDFDRTLSTEAVQKYVQELQERGYEVWVVTSRYDEAHIHLYERSDWTDAGQSDLWEVVDRLNIPREHVRFTNMTPKCHYIANTKFLFHLDDDISEILDASDFHCNVPFIFYVNEREDVWKNHCERILKHKENDTIGSRD